MYPPSRPSLTLIAGADRKLILPRVAQAGLWGQRANSKGVGILMDYLAKIYITLKPAVNDPQGVTVIAALKNLGFNTPVDVRVGKYLEVSLGAESEEAAENQVDDMCTKLLANMVIEQYRFDLEEVPGH